MHKEVLYKGKLILNFSQYFYNNFIEIFSKQLETTLNLDPISSKKAKINL